MSLVELFLIALGLSMDALAVAICAGLAEKQLNFKKMWTVGLYFGIFQAVMPLIGYFIASQFADKIVAFDHWIAFIFLLVIGGNMIKNSFEKEENVTTNSSIRAKKMIPLALATSIDALAVGVSFAFLDVNIYSAVTIIGIITLILSMIGVKIGHVFGSKFKAKAEIFGGIILILMGTKILLEHLNIIQL